MADPSFADLLTAEGVEESLVLRSAFGFMAYHGGGLEQMTDVIAAAAAERAGASYYGIVHPPGWSAHVSSIDVDPAASPQLDAFLAHVRVVVTVHGYGRRWLMTSILLGGRNRGLASDLAGDVRAALPAYRIVDDLDDMPTTLRGLHPRNPVNLPTEQGVQVELPMRARGLGPMWWDWESGLTPHTDALIGALARTATRWTRRAADDPAPT